MTRKAKFAIIFISVVVLFTSFSFVCFGADTISRNDTNTLRQVNCPVTHFFGNSRHSVSGWDDTINHSVDFISGENFQEFTLEMNMNDDGVREYINVYQNFSTINENGRFYGSLSFVNSNLPGFTYFGFGFDKLQAIQKRDRHYYGCVEFYNYNDELIQSLPRWKYEYELLTFTIDDVNGRLVPTWENHINYYISSDTRIPIIPIYGDLYDTEVNSYPDRIVDLGGFIYIRNLRCYPIDTDASMNVSYHEFRPFKMIHSYPISGSLNSLGDRTSEFLRVSIDYILGRQYVQSSRPIDFENVDLTKWIVNATRGILDAELFGFISLGGLLGIIMTISLLFVFIKVFGGA